MNAIEFSKQCPEGFAALPKGFQEKDELEFWQPKASYMWKARPKFSEIPILGNWEIYFSRENKSWYDSDTHRRLV